MRRTRDEVADYIENFLNGNGGPWDWDDFTSVRIDDPELDQVRIPARQDQFDQAIVVFRRPYNVHESVVNFVC